MTTSTSLSAGFTLIEMMMAMLIMTVGLLGLLQSVIVAFEHNTRNVLREEAIRIGDEQMNALRVKSTESSIYTHLKPSPGDDSMQLSNVSITKRIRGGDRTFLVHADMRTIKDTKSMDDFRKIGVHVRWGFKGYSTTHDIFTITGK